MFSSWKSDTQHFRNSKRKKQFLTFVFISKEENNQMEIHHILKLMGKNQTRFQWDFYKTSQDFTSSEKSDGTNINFYFNHKSYIIKVVQKIGHISDVF